jgi:hypothetical protein
MVYHGSQVGIRFTNTVPLVMVYSTVHSKLTVYIYYNILKKLNLNLNLNLSWPFHCLSHALVPGSAKSFVMVIIHRFKVIVKGKRV